MKSKYAFVVCADIRYLPEVVAELNSLSYVGNKQDVHFYGYKIPQEVKDQFSKLEYQVFFWDITDEEIQESHGLSEVVCRKRYLYADIVGQEYEAICVLDADMIFTRDPIHYFEIAAKTGLVVCAGKEQNKVYDDPHHQFNGEWIIPKGYYNPVDLCNCPLFVDTSIWGKALYKSFAIFIEGFNAMEGTNFKAPDMDAMNICLLEAGSADKTLILPGIQWLSTNEQLLKPYIRAVMDRGLIKTECGIPIFSYHGQYYHKKWRECQLDNRHNCAAAYLKADKSEETMAHMDNQAKGAMNLLYENFMKMLDYKIQIPKLNYRHPELPYEG
jgi:hypothetical protein